MPFLPRKPEKGSIHGPLGAHPRRWRDRHSDPGEGECEALPQLHRQPASDRPGQPPVGLLWLPSLAKLRVGRGGSECTRVLRQPTILHGLSLASKAEAVGPLRTSIICYTGFAQSHCCGNNNCTEKEVGFSYTGFTIYMLWQIAKLFKI